MKTDNFYNTLLDQVLRGKLSVGSPDFCKWLEESRENEERFNEELVLMAKEIETAERLDVEQLYKNILDGVNRNHLKRRIKRIMQYAAIVFLLLGVGGVAFFWDTDEPVPQTVLESNRPVVGNNLMTLILPEGEQVLLNRRDSLKQVEGGIDIIFENGCKQKYRTAAATSYNTLKTPLCCDFCLTLSDGTKVWMNALSTLRYPVAFSKNERTVYASGELYLEVAKDSKRPFYVILDSMKIEVLGTSFNINAYTDDNKIEVTLEKGRIRAYADHRIYDLLPDRQLRMNRLTKEVDIRSVKSVDYTLWKNGRYVFKGEPLCDVVKVLKRWYGIEFVFEKPEFEDMVFTGVVDKDEAIDVFIKRLSVTSKVECEKAGQKIWIRKK